MITAKHSNIRFEGSFSVLCVEFENIIRGFRDMLLDTDGFDFDPDRVDELIADIGRRAFGERSVLQAEFEAELSKDTDLQEFYDLMTGDEGVELFRKDPEEWERRVREHAEKRKKAAAADD